MTKTTDFDVIIIGGGFSGIYQTYKFRELGFRVHAFERSGGLGGVWRNNVYPGARVDSEVPMYQLWIKECYDDFNFTERFPDWQELQRYFAHADAKLHISKEYDFNTTITHAHFNEGTGRWNLEAVGNGVGRYTARHLAICTGFASKIYIPDFKGIEKFKGVMHHTAEWPVGQVDMKGKRVGVIGTGASGVQVIQQVGPEVEHLTVFQRTPNQALPMNQMKIDPDDEKSRKPYYDEVFYRSLRTVSGYIYGFDPRSALEVSDEVRNKYFERLWEKGGFYPWVGTFYDVWTDPKADNLVYQFWRQKVISRLKRPEMHEKLAPKESRFTFCGKRPSLEMHYYEVFNQPNVDLVDVNTDPIIEFTENGIRTAEHGEIPLDIIVLATGFDAVTGGLTQMDVRGLSGQSLAEKWCKGVSTYLGVCTNDFPNMYFLYGPQSPTAFANGPTCAQIQADWITDVVLHCERNNLKSMQPSKHAEEQWRIHVNLVQGMTLVGQTQGSWYTGGNIPGKHVEALNYLGGIPKYLESLGREADSDFRNFEKTV